MENSIEWLNTKIKEFEDEWSEISAKMRDEHGIYSHRLSAKDEKRIFELKRKIWAYSMVRDDLGIDLLLERVHTDEKVGCVLDEYAIGLKDYRELEPWKKLKEYFKGKENEGNL